MSIRYFLHKSLFFLTPLVMVVLLYLYGNSPEHFDNIYIGALCISAIFCWKDKDSFGALVVLLSYWFLSRVLYLTPDNPFFWFLIYGGSLTIAVYYFRQTVAKVLMAFVLFAASIETYWWVTGYDSKPRVIYFIGLMAITVWLQRLLFNRAFLMSRYFGYSAGKVALDGNVVAIFYGYYILVSLMAAEYFVRHLTSFKGMLFIYNVFSPISIFMSALTLTIIYMHYFHNQSQKHLSA